MFTVSLSRPSPSGLPVAVRFPACSAKCAALVTSLVSQPVYEPRPATPGAGTYVIREGRGRNARRLRYREGGYRAVLRPAKVRTGPAETSGECGACGCAVTVPARNEQTGLQIMSADVSDSWE